MGLDQYLYKGDYDTSEENFSVEEWEAATLAYWRKANQVHAWFVENVQNGVDDCGVYVLDTEKLAELLDACNSVLADRSLAEKLLPTTGGFFFGSTEYGEYYFGQLEETVKLLSPVIDAGPAEYQYHSSW